MPRAPPVPILAVLSPAMRLFTPPLLAALLLGLVALSLAAPRPQDTEYYDEEEEEAPPPPPPSTAAPVRSNPLNRGRSSIVPRKPAAKKASETTTAAPPPPPAPESSEEEADVDAPSENATTEAPKKYLIAGRNGVVRPFRTNDDLLTALKRRRLNQVSTHSPPSTVEPPTTAAPRQSKSQRLSSSSINSNGKRGRFGNARVPEATQEVQDAPQPVSPPRRSANVFSRRPTASRRVQDESPAEEAEETQHSDEVQAPRANRFSPRRRS